MSAEHAIQYMKIMKLHETVQGTPSMRLKSQPQPNLYARSSLCLETPYVRHSMASGRITIQCVLRKTTFFG